MSSIYGENIHISIFGQSHSAAIGVAIDGIPAGLAIDTAALNAFMRRRAPGQNEYSTARREADEPEFLSGIADGHTCGAPIAARYAIRIRAAAITTPSASPRGRGMRTIRRI